ncbi:MAG: ornithine carbamoyltransferase [Candidatus Promineifilaceae bacterium]
MNVYLLAIEAKQLELSIMTTVMHRIDEMKHFLNLTDIGSSDVMGLLELAVKLKKELKAGGNRAVLKGKQLAMVFQKPSLRTRTSFEIGMVQLGGYALSLSPAEVKMGERESPADVARVLSGYVHGIMARVLSHDDVVELAEYASIPVINGLSDYNHPVQTMADLLTMYEQFGKLDGLKVTYVGDGNNVARSLMFGAMHTGINFTIASPAGYMLDEEDFDMADRLKSGSATLQTMIDPERAVAEADVIYTDVWTSMGQENERAQRLEVFPPYQINDHLLNAAKPETVAMHCLPAHRGEEISASVADGPRAVIFQQAENRMHAQKAILAKLMG